MQFVVTGKSLTKELSNEIKSAPSFRTTLLACAIAAATTSTGLASISAFAAEAGSSDIQASKALYSIAPGPLAAALNEFASTAGITLSFDPAHVRGLDSKGVRGNYSVSDALHILLAGSGMQVSRTSSGAYLVMPAPQAGAAQALPTVNVRATTITSAENTVSYDRDQLTKLNPKDIKDVFKRDASVSVGGSIAANQKVYVRGVEETAMAVTVDGARQNNKVFHHNTTNLIDPSLLKAVRASAGVSPADDGPGAIGGSIVYETVDVADVLAPGDSFGGFAGAGYRTNRDVFSANAALMTQANGFELLGYANKHQGGDYDDGDSNTVRFTGPALTSFLLKTAYESATAGRFEISHESSEDDASRPYRANVISVGRPGPESRRYEIARDNTIVQYSRETGSGLLNPSVLISDSKTRVRTLGESFSTGVDTGGTSSTSAKIKNIFHIDSGQISAGFDYYRDDAKFESLASPGIIEEKANNKGLFVQVRQGLTKHLDLSYGLRRDDQTFTGTDGTTFDRQGTSANLSTDLRLGEYISLNAGFAKVWGGVALAENYILNGAWDYSDGIAAAESDNYSVGIKTHYKGFLLEGTLFETDINNGRTPVWRTGPDIVADYVIDGFDVLFGFIGTRGEITLAYADIESTKDGRIASSYEGNYFTAPLGRLITLNAELNFYDSRVQLGLNGEKALKNNAIESEGRAQPGYTVLNAYADYRLHENISLRFFVDNLTDKAYVDRATYGQEFVEVTPVYEPGRSVGVDLRFQF